MFKFSAVHPMIVLGDVRLAIAIREDDGAICNEFDRQPVDDLDLATVLESGYVTRRGTFSVMVEGGNGQVSSGGVTETARFKKALANSRLKINRDVWDLDMILLHILKDEQKADELYAKIVAYYTLQAEQIAA